MTFKPYDQRTKESDRFAMLPMVLLEDDLYKGKLDMAAIVAYSLLRNRQSLSIHKGWVDEQGHVYCHYSRENLAEKMNMSVRSVDKLLKQLKDAELIKTVRQGLNKPNRIYVGLPDYSGPAKSAHPDVQDLPTSYKEGIKKELNNITPFDNGGRFKSLDESIDMMVNLYGEVYQRRMGKEHPRLKEEQLDTVIRHIDRVIEWRSVTYDESEELMNRYFDEYVITGRHDGNINAFSRMFDRMYLEQLAD